MEINLSKAVKKFFPNPSLEMVYFEAVANALDASANEISIEINLQSFLLFDTLKVKITDNGKGFDNKNFKKFCKLMQTEEEDHNGLGRLVYLHYFRKVGIESIYENQKRTFTFTESFDRKSETQKNLNLPTGSVLTFSNYSKGNIKTYDYVRAKSIKKALIIHFFPRLHSLKKQNKEFKISIIVNVNEPSIENDFYSDTQIVSNDTLPELESINFTAVDLFGDFTLYYSIKQTFENAPIVTAICAEGRTIPLDIIQQENIPQGYDLIFLLYSRYFDGKVNSSRQRLEIEDHIFKQVKNILIEKIGTLLNEVIPTISERNEKVKASLNEKFPHLQGYFNENSIGLIDRNKSLETAQKKFFQAQKETLESTELTNEQYEKSLEVSARLLTEYILYRNIIISKLKSIDKTSSEADIHNLIIPKRKKLNQANFINDLYSNNAWLLDEKYMTFTTILSDLEMNKLLKEIEEEDEVNSSKRPDIAIVFSNNPENTEKVDVVIVELKKLDVQLAKNEEVISQLKQRARKLVKYYDKKIQRIWFYGVVEFTEEFLITLAEEKYVPLFSKEKV